MKMIEFVDTTGNTTFIDPAAVTCIEQNRSCLESGINEHWSVFVHGRECRTYDAAVVRAILLNKEFHSKPPTPQKESKENV